MKIKLVTSVLLFLATSAFAQDAETSSFQQFGSMQEILQQAKKENKLVFIDCYFTGCHPCAQMDKEVYPNATVLPVMSKDYISVKVDVFKEKLGDTLMVRYALHGFPTLLALDADGKLISHESGYKDAGQFLQFLNESKEHNKQKKYLSGFSTTYKGEYPAFYTTRYLDKKQIDAVAANKFIHEQKDWLEEKAALAILTCPKLDSDIEDYLLKNVKEYITKFGDEMVHDRIEPILTKRMNAAVAGHADEQTFQTFLQNNKSYFPESNWKNCLQVLANGYYLSVAKDTTAYLQFMSKNPVIYHYYAVAFHSSALVKNSLTQERCKLFCEWLDKSITSETSLDIINLSATLHKRMGDTAGAKKYNQLALDKVRKYKMDGEDRYQKLLAGE